MVDCVKFQPSIHQEDGYDCTIEGVPHYVAAKFITLYGSNTPFESQQWVLLGSLIIQLSGALLLFLHFLPGYGWLRAAKWGVFHSVSASWDPQFSTVAC